MSLLLDALKRAEQEKQARQVPDPAPQAPARAAKPALELAPVASPEAATASRSAPFPPPPPVKAAPESKKRQVLWIGGVLIALVMAGAIAYIWYSIDALTPKPIARVPAPRPITPAPGPATEPPKADTAKAEAPAAAKAAQAPAAAAAKPRVTEVVMDESAPPSVMLQPSRGPERARIAPEVAAGYEALRRGDLASARRNYAAAQAADPTNLDAVLGLATVEAQGGNRDLAFVLYRRALEIDPRNATALAGLAALSDLARPEMLEPQLLRDISQQPASAALHFMLGNLYAFQSRWSQAQAAYFDAHRLDPFNPDIAHNLAVSLDRLGQARVAATYYRRALDGARTQAAQFDEAAVRKRLAEIDGGR